MGPSKSGSHLARGAILVFAKLDRLTRNVGLLRALVASEVDLVFCDLPSIPPGAMGRFLLTQMAAVAELEAGLIGERTKAALAAAKARGVDLGLEGKTHWLVPLVGPTAAAAIIDRYTVPDTAPITY